MTRPALPCSAFVVRNGDVFLSGFSLNLRGRRGGTLIEYEATPEKGLRFDTKQTAQTIANIIGNRDGTRYVVEPFVPPAEAAPKKRRVP